jgi:hypothetical protein
MHVVHLSKSLFIDPKTSMLFGDARQPLLDLALQVKVARTKRRPIFGGAQPRRL